MSTRYSAQQMSETADVVSPVMVIDASRIPDTRTLAAMLRQAARTETALAEFRKWLEKAWRATPRHTEKDAVIELVRAEFDRLLSDAGAQKGEA